MLHAALVFEGELVSYGQLEWRTSILAYRLQGVVCRDGVVGLCLEKSVEEVVGMVGIMRAGAAYVPLDARMPSDRLVYLVEQCMCVAVVVQRRFALPVGPAVSAAGKKATSRHGFKFDELGDVAQNDGDNGHGGHRHGGGRGSGAGRSGSVRRRRRRRSPPRG